jgi:hypothetical protein
VKHACGVVTRPRSIDQNPPGVRGWLLGKPSTSRESQCPLRQVALVTSNVMSDLGSRADEQAQLARTTRVTVPRRLLIRVSHVVRSHGARYGGIARCQACGGHATASTAAALYLDSSLRCEQVGTGDSPSRLGSLRPFVSRGVARSRGSSKVRTVGRGRKPASCKVGSRRAGAEEAQ